MELTTAIRLIEKGIGKTRAPQMWADLGAGQGLFSDALSTLLPSGSQIFAVDTDAKALEKIKIRSKGITVKTVHEDFNGDLSYLGKLHGILMCNSLHFIADKLPLLARLKESLTSSGRIILVEYEIKKASPWVPYPVTFAALGKLITDAGFATISKIGTEPSVFNDALMYSVLIY